MKLVLIFCAVTLACAVAQGGVYTNSASADTFVRANAPTSNYGGSGADSVSGAGATNAAGVANGAFDTFIRFNTFPMVTNFNALYGSNSWAITGATLQVMEQAAPNNALFNRGIGAFEIRWIANDNWVEGTGSPTGPTTTGLVYTNEPALLNAATDVTLGAYTNAGVDTVQTFSLSLPGAFVDDMEAGGEVGFFITAADPNIGFTFGSRTFNQAVGRPYLIVSALPRPGIAAADLVGQDLNLSCTNGVSGATYRVLATSDLNQPVSNWTAIATTTLDAAGPFSVTITNALASGVQQFFSIEMQ